MTYPTPEEIKAQKIYTDMGMTDSEFELAVEKLGRLPNYTELGLFSVMWSEHCSYKSSKVLLRHFPTTGPQVLLGPGEGAGIVDIGDEQGICFKLESHNHPSAVEPFNGAATGVGGIVRDVFSMGARPIAGLNSLRFGELTHERTKFLLTEVVKGIAFYGNTVGVPTTAGEIAFDPCYQGNPLVNAMVVGLINHKDIKKGQAHGEGNTVIYAGDTTGRCGIHGATFSSEELVDGESKSSSVPAGNPALEKRLIEACLEVVQHPALVGIQDMGAAGLISSSAEMASKAGMGIELVMDHVPLREPGLSAYEMMLSESQERMLLVVKKGEEEAIHAIFKKHDIISVNIGRVTGDKNVTIIHNGVTEACVPADALASEAPEYDKPRQVAAYYTQNQQITDPGVSVTDATATLKELLQTTTIASKRWAYSQYDSGLDANTAVAPGSSAGVVRIAGTNKAVAMTTDCNGRYVYLDPHKGGQIAVAEAARNIVASGAKPLAITDNLNFGSPDNPEIFWQLEQACQGISAACLALDTPVISGNVSLYNEHGGSAIYPTPTIGMVGLIANADHITTSHMKQAGHAIYLLGETHADFGGSELQKLQHGGKIFGHAPRIDLATERANQDAVLSAIQQGLVASADDISEGGLAVALSEGLFENQLGATVTTGLSPVQLFAESQSRFVLTVSPQNQAAFETAVPTAKLLGHTNDSGVLDIDNGAVNAKVSELHSLWANALEKALQ